MAEASLSPEKQDLEVTSRKRTASESNEGEIEGSPEAKKISVEVDPLDVEELLGLGQYPFNYKRTCVMHDHSGDTHDPQVEQSKLSVSFDRIFRNGVFDQGNIETVTSVFW